MRAAALVKCYPPYDEIELTCRGSDVSRARVETGEAPLDQGLSQQGFLFRVSREEVGFFEVGNPTRSYPQAYPQNKCSVLVERVNESALVTGKQTTRILIRRGLSTELSPK